MKRIKELAGSVKPGTAVFLAAAAAYLPLTILPFVFDDVASVMNNPFLRHFSSAASLFSQDYTRIFRNESFEPLTYLLLMPVGRLFAWQPWGMHLFSALAHAACAWAVYKLAEALLGARKPALIAGLFFALHPVQSESMIAVLFTGTIFSALFFLWALYRFIEGDGRDSIREKLLTSLLFGVSLLFKERAFTGLLLFGLLPFLKPAGGMRELRRRLPELLAITFFWAAALAARQPAGRGSSFGLSYLDPAYLAARLAAYAKMLVMPFWLSPVYQKTAAVPGLAGFAALAAACLVLGVAQKYGRRGRKGYPPVLTAAALAFILLLPYLNLLPVSDLAEYLNSVFVSGRYLYLPMAGLAIIFGAFADRLEAAFPRGWAVPAGGAALAALFLCLSFGQQLIWRSDEAVWKRALKINPGSPWAAYMLGSYYMKDGLPDKARPLLERAASLEPSRGVLSNTLGALAAVHMMKGEPAQAEKLAVQALKTWEYNYDAWNTYGAALATLGRKQEAARAFENAGSAEITGDAPLVNLGKIYLDTGEPAKAAQALERALARARTPASLDLLCSAYTGTGSLERAAAACMGSLELEPRQPDTLVRLSLIYSAMGMAEPASLCLDEALKLAPEKAAEINKIRIKKKTGR
jgi:tetratricopeptide (TPR) repeat protein